MDFPAYVPAAVREHLTHYLEGESDRSIPGYIEILANADSRLAEIDGVIERCIRRGEEDYLPSLRKQRAEAAEHRDMLARDVDCLRRLADNARMRDAFAFLIREFSDDQQWRSFIHCAWSAKIDFSKYREGRKWATELKAEIADAADGLAGLIRQFSEISISGPDELYSIPELLRKTDNHDMQGHNLEMWRGMRAHVLGDIPRGGNAGGEAEQKARDMLRYAWGTAPDLSELLDTLARAARDFKPVESGFIGAAIESRQRSEKTEYLRAFGNLFTDAHHLTVSTAVMQAMAVVADVVINQPGVGVTYDDVRKALANLGG